MRRFDQLESCPGQGFIFRDDAALLVEGVERGRKVLGEVWQVVGLELLCRKLDYLR